MSRSWIRAWLCGAMLGLLVMPAIAGESNGDDALRKEIESLRELVESQSEKISDQKRAIDELQADEALTSSAVERAIDEALARRAAETAEGSGTAGFMGGKFRLDDGGDGNSMVIGGRLHTDLRIHETDTSGQNNRALIRRARLHVKGTVADFWNYKLEYDFAPNSLRDAFIAVKFADLTGIESEGIGSIQTTVGQQKVRFSRSELLSSNSINTVERPMIVSALAPRYDQGVFFSNSYLDGMLGWTISVTNGTDTSGDEFAYAARVTLDPFEGDEGSTLESLSFGLNGYYQSLTNGTAARPRTAAGWALVGSMPMNGTDARLGLDAHWHNGPFGVTAEGLYADQEMSGDDLEIWGGYLQLAYMVTGGDWSENPDEGLEAVLQAEYFEGEVGSDDASAWACTLGFNYYFNQHVRFMLNWVATDVTDDDISSPSDEGSGGLDHNLLARLQLVF